MRLTRTRADMGDDGTPPVEATFEDRVAELVDDDMMRGDLLNAGLASPTSPALADAAPTASEGDTLLPDQAHDEFQVGPDGVSTPVDDSGSQPMQLPPPPVPAPPAHVIAPPAPTVPVDPTRQKRRGGKAARRAAELVPETDDQSSRTPPSDDAHGATEGPRHSGRPLGELLVGRGLVSEDQLGEALTKQTTSGKRLGNLLVELGLLGERALTDVLAEQLGLEVVDLSRAVMDPEVVALLDEEDARRLAALPTHRDGSRVEVRSPTR